MNLEQTIAQNLKEAMKAGDTFTRDTLRLAQSAMKNAALEKRKAVTDLTDEEVLEVLKRLVKQRKDSVEQYRQGSREDLAQTEEQEITVLSAYMPAEMDDPTLESTVKTALENASLKEKKDMGKAMGVAMGAVKGAASGDRVKAVVQNILI